MRKVRYVFSHAVVPAIAFVLLAAVLTNAAWYVISQRRSVLDGIEVILVDSALTLGDNSQLAQSIRETVGVPYVGVSSLSSEEAKQYVATVEHYTLKAHIETLARSHDAELLFVPEALLPSLLPLALPLDFPDDGRIYAVPVEGLAVTSYGAFLTSLGGDVYALLLPGDHTEQARQFLQTVYQQSTSSEEE